MRVLLIVSGLLFSVSAFSAESAKQTGYLVKTVFEYQDKNKTSKSESSFIIDAKNNAWTTLTEPKDGIALLGRVATSDSDSLRMEYIVVDTNQKNAVISTPAIYAVLGEPAKIEVGESDGKKVSVSILAKPTEYKSKH